MKSARFACALVGSIAIPAACAPTLKELERDAIATKQREDRSFDAAVARTRAGLTADLLDLHAEPWGTPRDGKPPGAVVDDQPTVLKSDARVTLRVVKAPAGEVMRIGYREMVGSRCNERGPAPIVMFARGKNDTVRLIFVEPVLEIRRRHVDEPCAVGGCGANPGPFEQVTWLPVRDVEKIVVERHPVPYVVVDITCDRPVPPT